MSAYDWMHLVRDVSKVIADAIKYHGEMTIIASRAHDSYEAENAANAIIRKHL